MTKSRNIGAKRIEKSLEIRQHIINTLTEMKTIKDIALELGKPKSAITHHIEILINEKWIRKQKKFRFDSHAYADGLIAIRHGIYEWKEYQRDVRVTMTLDVNALNDECKRLLGYNSIAPAKGRVYKRFSQG
ncbi:hypothetical protein UFOVP263_6 [uncultured Caudovirales phage]|uniref:Uncharacterized protein n=1 Tax=uncultured Caudovirales phage TaxID=2100421 RepID=A0A6J5TB07_9CAUD|nr:hypothetical protein UFOVP263_6 [uncultured Caudovirales phage]CAB4242157.1 hypothetical protein UFOVP91_57 [uncultured Caudovirales phage]